MQQVPLAPSAMAVYRQASLESGPSGTLLNSLETGPPRLITKETVLKEARIMSFKQCKCVETTDLK